MDLDPEDIWSDTSEEGEVQSDPPLSSRAYQIEMFNHSMKENIIAVMGTGSGKTQIAKLRIEAELERSPGKLVWFTAPSVVLAYQQYRFLSQQLPAFQFRLITGMDSPDYWTTKDVWDQVLHNIHVVVSTPAILKQALNYGFISLAGISLLVFDEAHHGIKNAEQNQIMQLHYHPYNITGSDFELPHILGLSASPVVRNTVTEKTVLEQNLHAICKTPLQQLDEYTAFVNMPDLMILTYSPAQETPSNLQAALAGIVSSIHVHDDPVMDTLRPRDDREAHRQLEKILKKNCTPAMRELQSLERSSKDIQESLGNWACDTFIKNCAQKIEIREFHVPDHAVMDSSPGEDYRFVQSCLRPLHEQILCNSLSMSAVHNISPKVQILLGFLQEQHCPDLRCLIFVKARNTAWVLTEILNNHPLTKDSYKALSFVGVSIPSHRRIFDFAELALQHDNLERFRRGELNVCVATSVLEEGIDVPAMNLVICFDERPNFRSFIQSRGRARQKGSRFVLFQEAAAKLQQWQALEDEMRQECEDSLRGLEERERIENIDESEAEVFRVESTGATLTYNGSRQLLSRFCAKLPRTDECEQPCPIFYIQGDIGVDVVATVCLPSSLPPSLQKAESKFRWRTEKKAKQDAAFQAYLALYKAGLVTEYLLPPEWPKETDTDRSVETRDSEYDVRIFVDYPHHPESLLNLYRARVVNNARLQRATRALGLDQYLTRVPFAGYQWSIGVRDSKVRAKKPPQNRLSSKTLADVVEAIIGAASLTGLRAEDKEAKILSVLRLFIDEVSWKPLSENIAKFQPPNTPSSHRHEALKSVEALIGYTFACHALLAQALTQSSLGGDGISSYERLEFLGDAVLDHIVKPKLFHSSLQLDPGQMTSRCHALVSHVTLAFFALQASVTRCTYVVQTDLDTKQTVSREEAETVYLPDHIKRIGNHRSPLERRATLAAYEEVRSSVLASFETGKKFPWSALSRLGAPKCYSDIMESILGAVFLDSGGDLTACEAVLEKMGYMKLVHRLVTDKEIDVRHPVARLGEVFNKFDLVAQERKKSAMGDSGRRSWRCKVMVKGERIAFVKGAACKEEATCRAAEKALEVECRKRKRRPSEQLSENGAEEQQREEGEEEEGGRQRDEDVSD
ncbi:Ribonuclease III domain-containing protein [Cladophialophora immunda]|nr:Ribonuclease III domain-containing protein [Cladophialophora immunda]